MLGVWCDRGVLVGWGDRVEGRGRLWGVWGGEWIGWGGGGDSRETRGGRDWGWGGE